MANAWGELTWGIGSWGLQNDVTISLTGNSLTTSQSFVTISTGSNVDITGQELTTIQGEVDA